MGSSRKRGKHSANEAAGLYSCEMARPSASEGSGACLRAVLARDRYEAVVSARVWWYRKRSAMV